MLDPDTASRYVADTPIARRGRTLTASPGTFAAAPDATLAFCWLRCKRNAMRCKEIRDAHDVTYKLGRRDVRRRLVFQTTATNWLGSVTASSDPTAIVKRGGKS